MNIIKDSIERYMRSQWVNYRRSLGFYEAREEILGGGSIGFNVRGATVPLDTWADEKKATAHCNPILASGPGEFPPIYIDGDYTVKLFMQSGEWVVARDTGQYKGFIS